MLDSVAKSDKNYNSQRFLEEWKYVQEKIKFENYINDELDSGSNDETESDSDCNDGKESDIDNNE